MTGFSATFRRARHLRGFTLAELLVAMGVIVILIAILIPIIGRAQQAAKSVTCISNLRAISSAMRLYANANQMNFPDPGSAVLSWEQMIAPYYQGGSFRCPSDEELYPSVGSSYDWRDTADQMTTMAGRGMAEVYRSDFVFVFEGLSGWHKKRKINVSYFDGSAATIDDDVCFQDLQKPIVR